VILLPAAPSVYPGIFASCSAVRREGLRLNRRRVGGLLPVGNGKDSFGGGYETKVDLAI
jgi:hypothetical protein